MNYFENIIYFLLFLLNKYIGTNKTEKWLSLFENKMILKYVSKTEIPATNIPIINANELTNERFVQLSNNYRRPIIIKGYMKDTVAVNKWNLEYLNNILEQFKINTVTYNSELEINEMTFDEFTKRHTEGYYINNNHTILSHYPRLFEDLREKFDQLIKSLHSTNLRNIHIANLFIGSTNVSDKTTGSNMHAGGSGNMFVQIVGRKTWTLIDPKYSCLMKGRVAENGIHAQTLFDMPDTKLRDYPQAFKHLPRYDVVLEPGDILWNAPWWFHRISNHDGLSIGMAIRNNKVTKLNLQNNFTYTLSGYIYLLYNTWTISLYEKYIGNKHFNLSKEEKKGDNVLYQIEKLVRKYPTSIDINTILKKDLSVNK